MNDGRKLKVEGRKINCSHSNDAEPLVFLPSTFHSARRAGFTLVEMLVVMVIFAIIGLASFQVVDAMIRSDEQGGARQDELQELQYAMLVMERDIRQIVARPVRGDQGADVHMYLTTDRELTNSDSDTLGFVRTGWMNPGDLFPRSALQPVVYRIYEEQLQRLSYPYVDQVSDDPRIEVLLNDIEEIDFRFIANRTNSTINWQDEWQQSGRLPRAIEVTLQTKKFGEIRRVLELNGGNFQQEQQQEQEQRQGGEE